MEPTVNTFFAVQLRPGETPHRLAAIVVHTAHEAKLLFRRLDTLDIIQIGGRSFVRFQSDVINPFPVLDRLLLQGRSTISLAPGSYLLRESSGKFGKVPGTAMHQVPMERHFRQYRGPRAQDWQAQFV